MAGKGRSGKGKSLCCVRKAQRYGATYPFFTYIQAKSPCCGCKAERYGGVRGLRTEEPVPFFRTRSGDELW